MAADTPPFLIVDLY